MKRALAFLFFVAAACGHVSNDGPAPLPVGHARMAIIKNGSVVISTRFDNLSSRDSFFCHHVGKVYEIEARRYVTPPKEKTDERTFQFFFPESQEMMQGAQQLWSDFPLSLFGKIKDKRLGGTSGRCGAKVQITGNVLTGNIFCTGFESPEVDEGIGPFDFNILDLLCTIT